MLYAEYCCFIELYKILTLFSFSYTRHKKESPVGLSFSFAEADAMRIQVAIMPYFSDLSFLKG